MEGDLKKYYDMFDKIIKEPDCCYNKKEILEQSENSWLKEPKIFLYSHLGEHDKALNELFNESKLNNNFEEIEKYCQDNMKSNPYIFQNFYKLISELFKNEYQDKIDKILGN